MLKRNSVNAHSNTTTARSWPYIQGGCGDLFNLLKSTRASIDRPEH